MLRLGKKPARHDERTLRLSNYLTPSLPPPPENVDNTHGLRSYGMMLNDALGDCTCAAYGHAEQSWTISSGTEWTPSDGDVLALYENACGYVPGNPSTDDGGDELTVLNYIRNNGFGGHHNLAAFADPELGNFEHIKQAIYLFGGVYIGIQLPLTAQSQVGGKWDVVLDSPYNQPGSWGGHAVWCLKYSLNTITCVTWGRLQVMTLDFWKRYTDEAHALISTNWKAPHGLNVAALEADLALVTR